MDKTTELKAQISAFIDQNHESVTLLKIRLNDATSNFLNGPAIHAIPPRVAEGLLDLLQKERLEDFHCHFRQHAVAMATNGLTEKYWSLVDAAGSLVDALTPRWAFLTNQDRTSRLHIASFHLNQFQSGQ